MNCFYLSDGTKLSALDGSCCEELEPSYCIATKKTDINKDLFINFIDTIDPDDIDWKNGLNNPSTGGGGGGSGGVSGNGSAHGSGEYQDGAYITCQAIPDSSYVFDRWVGDLWGEEDYVNVNVTSYIEATAYFHHLLATGPFRPCYDALKDLYNPLVEMSIAPTGRTVTNFRGSTFGFTRNNGAKEHNGLDLYAEEGTPIYASYDGVISKTQRYATCQPNRDAITGELPLDYSGDDNGAGNRFSIDYEKNGNIITFAYWHLQAGMPIAVNPRTGDVFKPVDKVFAGEIIGYTGRTGNAYDVAYKHLHLGVKLNGDWVDPADYINGELQWNNESKTDISETEIINIKCNDESIKFIGF